MDNPVSRQIVLDSVFNRIEYYFPYIRYGVDGYFVGAKLPEKAYKKWISYINGFEKFRETVKREIEEIFSRYVFRFQSYLEICWAPDSVTFNTDGDACGIDVLDEDEFGYVSHNVDHYEQATVLFIALSIYLPRLYFALEEFESGSVSVEKFQPLKKELCQKIKLKKV
jgi:hypothetical protein